MVTNKLKKALLERKLTLGTWIQLGHSGIAEIFANAGFDWIAADCEHTDIGIKEFTEIARGMYGRESIPLVRVRENDTLAIRQSLDMGAQGVIVPLVNTAEDAAKAVLASKFPPEGVRGCAFFRGNDWGKNFDEYVEKANENTVVVVMIETKQGVENIDEILSVKGVDGVFIGPYDMSISYGIGGQTSHPIILEACTRISKSCEKYGKSAGIHVVKPDEEQIKRALKSGFTFIALGMDTVFLDCSAGNILNMARIAAENLIRG